MHERRAVLEGLAVRVSVRVGVFSHDKRSQPSRPVARNRGGRRRGGAAAMWSFPLETRSADGISRSILAVVAGQLSVRAQAPILEIDAAPWAVQAKASQATSSPDAVPSLRSTPSISSNEARLSASLRRFF
jgi:hypothetical protein